MSRRSLGLVLGSGSARGLAHIGVLKVWEREQLPLDLIVGTSMGALVGGVYACGMSALEMEEVALSVDIPFILSLADLRLPRSAFFRGHQVERFVQGLVEGRSFADTRLPFACVAVDLAGGREVVLSEGDLASAIRASVSTPVLFAPVTRGGLSLVDGAVLNPVPVDVARDMGAELAVAVSPHAHRECFLGSVTCQADLKPEDIHKRSLYRSARSRVTSLVGERMKPPLITQTAASSVGLMQWRLSEPRLHAADLAIVPDMTGTSIYGFRDAKMIIERGERATEKALAALERLATSEAALSG